MLCASAITLHINSPCTSANNTWGEQLGARGIGCASGDLTSSTTLTTSSADPGGVTVTSDLRVPYGEYLGVDGDVTILFDSNDEANLGHDAAKNELIAIGNVALTGTSGHMVVLKGTSSTEGSWYGVDAGGSNLCDVEFAEIQNAVYGIVTRDTGSSSVTDSHFLNNSNIDVIIGSGGSSVSATVEDNTIEVGSSGTGVEFLGNVTGAALTDNVITGNGSATRGVHTGTGTGSSTPSITGNSISGFSNGDGIRIEGGSNPTITTNSVTGCKQGIYVANGAPLIGTASSSSDNTITGNTSGIYVTGSSAAPKVRNNEIHSNTYGVNKKTSSSPDLGVGGDLGKNDLSGNNTYCIYNQAGGVVPAVGNYWGVCSPGPPSCTSGSVLGDSALCVEPAAAGLVAVGPALRGQPLVVKSVVPNPMRESGVIGIASSVARQVVDIKIYDLSGRKIRSFENISVSPGYQEILWDGKDEQGTRVSSGLYFIRVRGEGAFEASSRVLVAR